MPQSSGCFESGLEGRPGVDDGPEHVHAPACEGDDGLVVTLSLAPLAFVEGSAVVVREGTEGRLIEDALEAFVGHSAAGGSGFGRTVATRVPSRRPRRAHR